MNKKIAIIKDGSSDFVVLKSFISSIFNNELNISLSDNNFVDLKGLQIGEAIEKYIDKANKTNETNINGKHASDLKNTIISILYAATNHNEFNNKDIIVLNGDAEHKLMKNENFFEDWVRRLYAVIYLSVDEFYDKMNSQGYSFRNLPIIIPLVLFPSIEILVAACYLSDNDKKTIRELRAKPDLKMKVWDTDNIPTAYENGKINEVLELCFSNNGASSLQEIYKDIPEVRNLMHILSYPEKQST